MFSRRRGGARESHQKMLTRSNKGCYSSTVASIFVFNNVLVSKLDKAEYHLLQVLELSDEEPRTHRHLCGDPAYNSMTRSQLLVQDWSDVDFPPCEKVVADVGDPNVVQPGEQQSSAYAQTNGNDAQRVELVPTQSVLQ